MHDDVCAKVSHISNHVLGTARARACRAARRRRRASWRPRRGRRARRAPRRAPRPEPRRGARGALERLVEPSRSTSHVQTTAFGTPSAMAGKRRARAAGGASPSRASNGPAPLPGQGGVGGGRQGGVVAGAGRRPGSRVGRLLGTVFPFPSPSRGFLSASFPPTN